MTSVSQCVKFEVPGGAAQRSVELRREIGLTTQPGHPQLKCGRGSHGSGCDSPRKERGMRSLQGDEGEERP